jgi:beta-glucosidase
MGKANPAGRLPVTWARALEDYPAGDPRHPERSSQGVAGRTTFSEGVDVGYRWFDRRGVEPLYPFGHGLSYTSFRYSGLRVARARDGGLDLDFQIANAGRADGDEVPQVYLGAPADPPAGVQFPVRKLAAFDRVGIGAGRTERVRLHVPIRQLQYWSVTRHEWVTAQGERKIFVGASSRDLRLEAVTPPW